MKRPKHVGHVSKNEGSVPVLYPGVKAQTKVSKPLVLMVYGCTETVKI